MSPKEAYDFLDQHIEREILFAYNGNKEKFDEAMRVLKEVVDAYCKAKESSCS